MYPTAAVSGWYFAHPEARYFGLGKIKSDQERDRSEVLPMVTLNNKSSSNDTNHAHCGNTRTYQIIWSCPGV